MDISNWINENLKPENCTSDRFIYDDMDSQSGYCLPLIYQPFDSSKRFHWADRGCLYDFLYSVDGEGKRILDFGPGDGWPSLIIAPYVKEVVGLDSSQKRVMVCSENARRLGILNARFTSYMPGSKIPFEDNYFDGIVASSSVEQTPNPWDTIKEFYRVLKPGGKLRIHYEALNRYKDGEERDIWIHPLDDNSCILIMYFRNIEDEYADQYALSLDIGENKLSHMLSTDGKPSFKDITIDFLEGLRGNILSSKVCRTIHPSGKTYASWMKEAGFREVHPTCSGQHAALKVYDSLSKDSLPMDLEGVDAAIRTAVKVAVGLEAPIETDPMLTVVK